MIRTVRVALAVAAALAFLLPAAVPAQARDWNWMQVHNAPILMVCKFWHPNTPYGPVWEVKAVGINNTAGPATTGVGVRRGANGPVVSRWSASLAAGQWSSIGTVFVSVVAGDVATTGVSSIGGGAGSRLELTNVNYC